MTNGRDVQFAPRAKRLIVLFLIFDLLAIIGVAAGLAATWYPKRLAEVEPGVLYRSAQPTGRQLRHVIDHYGIKTVVIARDGDSERIVDEKRAAAEAGIQVVQLPIVSGEEIGDAEFATFQATLSDPANRPVLVHCAAGRHRTGLLCAIHRVRGQGWDAANAREEMLSFGFEQERHKELLDQFDRIMGGATTQATGGVTGAPAGR